MKVFKEQKNKDLENQFDERAYDEYLRSGETWTEMLSYDDEDKSNWFYIHSNSINILRFDFLTCILVLFDCFFIPFKITFDLDEFGDEAHQVMSYLSISITAIFIIDLILSFFRAYIDDETGGHVTSLKMIAKRYLKFYFWIDLLGCMYFDQFTSYKSLSIITLIKTIRLLRFQKLSSLIGINSIVQSKMRIAYLIMTLIIFINFATCYYFYLVNKNYQKFAAVDWLNVGFKVLSKKKVYRPKFEFQFWLP